MSGIMDLEVFRNCDSHIISFCKRIIHVRNLKMDFWIGEEFIFNKSIE
jgi:hypothetical protein